MADYSGFEPVVAPAVAAASPPDPAYAGFERVAAPGMLESLARGAAEGATLGFGDEIGLLSRERQEASRRANPWTHFAGEMIGTIAPAVVAAPVAAGRLGASAVARGAQAVARPFVFGEATTLPGSIGQGARLGATYGALGGAGHADPRADASWPQAIMQRAGGAVTGGLAGGVAGGVLSPVLHTLGSGVRAGGNVLADYTRGESQTALRQTARSLERQGTEPVDLAAALVANASPQVQALHANNPAALTAVLRGFEHGRTATQIAGDVNRVHGMRLTPQQVGALRSGFDRANPQPRDLLRLSEEVGGGEAARSGLTSTMQAIASLPGRGRELALRNMGRTMEEAPERLVQRLSAETGSGTNFRGELAARQAARAQEAQSTYGAAYQAGTANPISAALSGQAPQTIPDLIQPVLTQYALRANNMAGERLGHLRRALEIMIGRSQQPGKIGTQTLKDYHDARTELDKLLTGLRRSQNPVDRDAARIIGEMRTRMNGLVHRAYPKFGDADRRFASAIAREEAMDLGRQYSLRVGTKQDDIIGQMRALERRNPTNAEELREYMMLGIMRNMADEVATSGGIPTSWVQPLTGGVRPAQQQALDAVMAAPLPNAKIAARGRGAVGQVKGQPVPHVPGMRMSRNVVDVLASEARLRKIFTDVFGNSNTAGKLAAMEDLRQLPNIAAEIASGGFLSGIKNAITKRLASAILERNTEQIARIATETNPRALYLALQEMNALLPGLRRGDRGIAAFTALSPASINALSGAIQSVGR